MTKLFRLENLIFTDSFQKWTHFFNDEQRAHFLSVISISTSRTYKIPEDILPLLCTVYPVELNKSNFIDSDKTNNI